MARCADLWEMSSVMTVGCWGGPTLLRHTHQFTLCIVQTLLSFPGFSLSVHVSSEDWAVDGLLECFGLESRDWPASDRKGFLLLL